MLFGTTTGAAIFWQMYRNNLVYIHSRPVSIIPTVLDDGLYHSVALISDGTTASCYIDGEFKGSSANSPASLAAGNKDFLIGDWIGGPGTYWTLDGGIQDMRVYDEALPLSQIQEYHEEMLARKQLTTQTENFTYHKPDDLSNEDGLVAAYNFKPEGSIMTDVSGNGNQGTVN